MTKKEDNDNNEKANSKIQVQLSPNGRSEIERIFPSQSADEVANNVAQLAFEEWLGWLSGNIRYASLTDQSIERVINLFTRLMPEKEPDVGFLYNQFSIPYGRARYICQVIIDRQLRELNKRAREQLIQTLEAEKAKCNKMHPEERKTLLEVRIEIDRRAEKILITCIDQMPAGKKPVESFQRVSLPFPNTRIYKLSPKDLDDVLEAVKQFKT